MMYFFVTSNKLVSTYEYILILVRGEYIPYLRRKFTQNKEIVLTDGFWIQIQWDT